LLSTELPLNETAITQNVQAYNAHQQALTTELSLCANYSVSQIEVTPTVVVSTMAMPAMAMPTIVKPTMAMPTIVTPTMVMATMVKERDGWLDRWSVAGDGAVRGESERCY
jgi:hypothetical protein